MQPETKTFGGDRPWPALVLLAAGVIALAAGALGGDFAAIVDFGSSL